MRKSTIDTHRITAIDTHAHVFHRGLAFVRERGYTPKYDALPEQYLALLDANGVSHGVIIPVSILGTDNRYTLEVMEQAKGRLRGLAVVDPETDLDSLDALAAAGIVGIRMYLADDRSVPMLDDGPWNALVSECVRRDWHIEVYDKASRLERIVAPLLDAGVKVVVDHFGAPDPDLGINDPGFRFLLGLGSTRRVWVKLSGPYRSSLAIAAAAAPLLLRDFGPERLLWGSDWPFTRFEKTIQYTDMRKLIDDWVPDPDQRWEILAETPARLYGF